MSEQLSLVPGTSPKRRREYVPITDELRLWNRVAITGVDECWEWQGGCTSAGYGLISRPWGRSLVHRLAYEYVKGPIPEALVLDHLCRNRKCCNPSHLEPCTISENVKRGAKYRRENPPSHCKRGHVLDEDGIAWTNGRWRCRLCKNAVGRAYRARQKAAAK